jgi:nucleoside-diphosphate-sugar epimerase
MKKTLMTGVTGFLGGHFLFQRLGDSGRTIAVVRGSCPQDGHARILRSLGIAARGYSQRPIPVRQEIGAELGDVARPLCGLSAERLGALRSLGVDEFWHFAASLAFEERKRAVVLAQNVGGALNALELATDLGVRRFVYVSTAYTAGRRVGLVRERLHVRTGRKGVGRPIRAPTDSAREPDPVEEPEKHEDARHEGDALQTFQARFSSRPARNCMKATPSRSRRLSMSGLRAIS